MPFARRLPPREPGQPITVGWANHVQRAAEMGMAPGAGVSGGSFGAFSGLLQLISQIIFVGTLDNVLDTGSLSAPTTQTMTIYEGVGTNFAASTRSITLTNHDSTLSGPSGALCVALKVPNGENWPIWVGCAAAA